MSEKSAGVPPDKRTRKYDGKNRMFFASDVTTSEDKNKIYRICATVKSESLLSWDIFELFRALPSQQDGCLDIWKSSGESMMLKVRIASKAEQMLLLLKTIVSKRRQMEVTVTEVVKLNQSEGVITAPELHGTDLKEIIEECEEVCDIVRMTKFVAERNQKEYTHTYKVSFSSRKVPETLTIGFLRFKVRCYYPAPRSCFACLKYNHILKDCPVRSKVALCRLCGLNVGFIEHEGKRVLNSHTCQRPEECPNCPVSNNEHSPMSQSCPVRIVEKEVIKMKVEHDISYREARSRVKAGSFVTNTKSFADALSNRNSSTAFQDLHLKSLERKVDELQSQNKYLQEKMDQYVKRDTDESSRNSSTALSDLQLKSLERKVDELQSHNEYLEEMMEQYVQVLTAHGLIGENSTPLIHPECQDTQTVEKLDHIPSENESNSEKKPKRKRQRRKKVNKDEKSSVSVPEDDMLEVSSDDPSDHEVQEQIETDEPPVSKENSDKEDVNEFFTPVSAARKKTIPKRIPQGPVFGPVTLRTYEKIELDRLLKKYKTFRLDLDSHPGKETAITLSDPQLMLVRQRLRKPDQKTLREFIYTMGYKKDRYQYILDDQILRVFKTQGEISTMNGPVVVRREPVFGKNGYFCYWEQRELDMT